MENLLNKSHPFRASVTHSMADGPPAAPATEAVAEQGKRGYQFNWFSALPLRKKLALIAVVGGLVGYGYISLWDLADRPARAHKSDKHRAEAAAVAEAAEESRPLEDRSVERAWQSAGLLHRIFCRGGETRSFCR